MKIATLLNVHAEPELVLDTVDSIRAHMTNDILVLVDGAFKDRFRNVKMPCQKMAGFYHNCEKAPYRNLTLGLMTLADSFDADWYCYIEYDCLVTSPGIKLDLASADPLVYCMGNDHRIGNNKFLLLEGMMKMEFPETHCLLGCCTFFRREFIRKLQEMDFFHKFLYMTNDFTGGFFPGFNHQEGYDFGEHLYPTLAANLGGQVRQLACYYGDNNWSGNYHRYPMRFRPEYDTRMEKFPEASIIHPVKSFDHPFRNLHRKKREKLCQPQSQSKYAQNVSVQQETMLQI